MSVLHPRKQASVSYVADCDVVVCYDGAKLTDKHLAARVHCVDEEIIGWLKRREQRRRRPPRVAQWQAFWHGQTASAANQITPSAGSRCQPRRPALLRQ